MKNFLYILAIILTFSWAIGFFAYGLGAIMHVLLAMALASALVKVLQGDKVVK